MEAPPEAAGLGAANWSGRVVRAFVQERCGRVLRASSGLNGLHRPGFVLKWPRKRPQKADVAQREAFVAAHAALRAAAQATGTRIFFVDEAHFRAEAELRAKGVLRGQPALVDSTRPKLGGEGQPLLGGLSGDRPGGGHERAPELHRGDVRRLSAAVAGQASHAGDRDLGQRAGPPWPGHLATPDLDLRLVALPAYSPDLNPDEAMWDWAREEVTANTCLGTTARARERVDGFFAGLAARTAEVQQRCRTTLQARADAGVVPKAMTADNQAFAPRNHVDLTLGSV